MKSKFKRQIKNKFIVFNTFDTFGFIDLKAVF